MKPLTRRSAYVLALALVALAFLALAAISSFALRGARVDLTDKQLYTLSEGTRSILGKIEEPITLKLYYSEHATRDLQQFRVFATRVRELLEEIAARSKGKVAKAGVWYSVLPGALVGRYAVGDVDRTEALFCHLYPKILREGMGPAYDRERRLLPIAEGRSNEPVRIVDCFEEVAYVELT